MKISLLVACAAACLATGVAVADDKVDASKPVELTESQMDKITAGSLELLNHPDKKLIFEGFLTPNGSALHPGLLSNPAFGPWQAHFNSPVIDEGP